MCIFSFEAVSSISFFLFTIDNFKRHFRFICETIQILEEDVFRLVTSVGQRKILSPHEESSLRTSDSAL